MKLVSYVTFPSPPPARYRGLKSRNARGPVMQEVAFRKGKCADVDLHRAHGNRFIRYIAAHVTDISRSRASGIRSARVSRPV